MTPDSFASLPLDEQLAALAHALDSRPREHSESELLELCRAVRDHAPMAWLARELLARGWLNQARHRQLFAAFLIAQSETAVNKVLRNMLELQLSPSARAPLAEMLVTCLETIPLARLSSMCLIDRALKHNFSERRVRHHQDNLARLLQALDEDALELVTVDRLAQVSAHDFEHLRARADAKGHRELLDTRHRELARQAVEVIASAPKAVSQSNAEELLARRVYTDPGHFLIELLQNAEDAGADTWRVVFDADAVTVWHNGAAFDTRDLVGVTSIGQTTKSKSQIGFFGVGFKSIYEITDRPRVFSDVYQFEIADISVPKVLGRRPPQLPAEGTVLVLPLRDPSDPVRSPQALFDKARALDPCVLFTLRGIDAIELELTAAAPGGPQHHIIREGQPDAQQRSTLSIDPPGEIQHYVVVDDEYRYTASKRSAGRADSTRVMVGVRVDERGKPMPLSEDASTVYSYLPTDEHSGLRFFVQGHFDVPVDRERITQDSDWNRWILEQVPAQLAKVARNAIAQGPELARGMLEVLPLASELGSPVFRALTRRLRGALHEVPLLPGHGKTLHRPREVLIASEPIVALFDDQPVLAAHLPRALLTHSKESQLVFLAPDLPARSVELAQALGCPSFTLEHLISLLKVELGPSEARPIAAMRGGDPARVREVYDVLLDGIEQLERERERLPLLGLVSKLKALPIVLDAGGQFLHPRSLVRAPRRLRSVYAGLTAFVHPDLDLLCAPTNEPTEAKVDEVDEERSAALDRCTAFLNRLGVASLEGPQLLGDLERELRERPVLERLQDTRLPGTPARLAALFEFLAIDATVELQRRAARLPLFAASDGRYYPIARTPADRAGVLIAHDDDLSQVLHAFYAGRRPITLLADCSEHVRTLLVQQQAPELDVSVLIDDLESGLFELDLDGFDALHTILEYDQERIPDRDRKRLAKQAIWPDQHGTPRPLSGGGRVLMPGFAAIEPLFPDAPFIHPLIRERTHVRDMGVEVVAAAAVLEALSPEARPPLTLTPSPEVCRAVLDFLSEHGEKLGSKGRKQLGELPLFLSDRGEVCRLAELRRASPELRALYGDYPGRHFVAEGSRSLAVIDKFALRGELREATPGTLVEDLREHAAALLDKNLLQPAAPLPLFGDAEGLFALLRYFGRHLDAMTRVEQESLASLPLFPLSSGALRMLGDTLGEDSDAREGLGFAVEDEFRAVLEAAELPLVHPSTQSLLAPLLSALGRRPLGLAALLTLLGQLEPVEVGTAAQGIQAHEPLAQVLSLLETHAGVLARSAQAADVDLNALPIWPSVGGAVCTAEQALVSAELEAVIAEGTPEHARLLAVLVTPEATAVFARLSKHFEAREIASVVIELVRRFGRAGAPLAKQERFLSTTDAIARLLDILAQEKHEGELPLVTASQTLHVGSLAHADEATVALIEGLPLAREVLDPSLRACVLEHFDERCQALEAARVIAAVAERRALRKAPRREAFYAWLQSHEREIFTREEARALLRSEALFLTEQGSMLAAGDLVMDEDLPDLGIDWRPSPSIPRATLQLLRSHLQVGEPDLDELLTRHVLPTYRRWVKQERLEDAAKLLAYLAKATRSWGLARLRALVGEDLLIEYGTGSGRSRLARPSALIWPEEELEPAMHAVWGNSLPRPSAARYGEDLRPFMRAIGVAALPAPADFDQAIRARPVSSLEHSIAIARIAAELSRARVDIQTIPALRQRAWVMSGDETVRRPSELFWSEAPDVMLLVGDFLDNFAHPRVEELLRERLSLVLGFKRKPQVQLADVVRRIEASAMSGGMVEMRVYLWMEAGLVEGRLEAAELRVQLADKDWICTDDHSFFNHRRVLGVNAVSIFGPMRGYWLAAKDKVPKLARAFGIPTRVTAESIIELLDEIGLKATRVGDRELLEREPGLPTRLKACYAELARLGAALPASSRPVILCEERHRPEGSEAPTQPVYRLLPAQVPSVFRSDTPTLIALFEAVSPIHIAVRGSGDERERVDQFHQRMGLRRIRDAYRVEPDMRPGQDRTETHGDAIQAMRRLLRALHSVMPRLQKEKGGDEKVWVYDQRLAPLAASGTIRVLESLTVRYVLDGVGEIRRATAAVYDQDDEALLLDVDLIAHPNTDPTDLALGIIDTIYDGADVQSFFSIIALLLQKRTTRAMNAYLDRLHYPEGNEQLGPHLLLAERIGQLFDLGLYRKLARRFAILREHEQQAQAWRDPALLERLDLEPKHTRRQWARKAAPTLLEVIGIAEPPEGLEQALISLLAADSVDDIDPAIYASAEDPTRDEAVELRRPPPKPSFDAPEPSAPAEHGSLPPLPDSPRPARERPGASASDDAELSQLIAQLSRRHEGGEIAGSSGAPASNGAEGSSYPRRREPRRAPVSNEAAAALGELLRMAASPEARAAVAQSDAELDWGELETRELAKREATASHPLPQRAGAWQRIKRWFGAAEPEAQVLQDQPAWADPEANSFRPESRVGPQLWATRERFEAMREHPPATELRFAPERLPNPYLYAIQTLAGRFVPHTQTWLPQGIPDAQDYAPSVLLSGRAVVFEGTLAPGLTQLPVPMYAELASPPQLLDGGERPRLKHNPDGSVWAYINAAGPVRVRYSVNLSKVPTLTGLGADAKPLTDGLRGLLEPTLARRDMPRVVRRWLEAERAKSRAPWERAMLAQAFVQTRYVYDADFMARPEVQAALARRQPGRGNHHLELLHASARGEVLGHGICYELNIMVVELLRHLGVPSMVATGWVLDEGLIHRPDHLFAIALVPSPGGLVMLPLDAATGAQGPIRPSVPRSFERHQSPSHTLAPVPGVGGPWDATKIQNLPTQRDLDRQLEALRASEQDALRAEARGLRELILYVLEAQSLQPNDALIALLERPPGQSLEHIQALRDAANTVLGRGELVEVLLAVARGDFAEVAVLPAEVRELAALGLVDVQGLDRYQVALK